MAVPTPPPAPPPPAFPPASSLGATGKFIPLAEEVKYLVEPLCSRAKEQGSAVFTLVHAVEPVIQQGPMCGLVALSIASLLLTGKPHSPEQLLSKARKKGYSNNGEIFSAQHLLDLATSELQCKGSLVHTTTVTSGDILTSIAQRRALVVPYDADKDHSPCLAQGHRAHWCTLVGFAVTSLPPPTVAPGTHVELSPADLEMKLLQDLGKDQVYVFARQGKSRHLGLWGLPALLESNANLVEAGDHRSPTHYVIPSQGICQSLASLLLNLVSPD